MKGFNLSNFKKKKEDKKTVTMEHPDGHTITISKASLPALQRKLLEKLPLHMDEGGDTPGANSTPSIGEAADTSSMPPTVASPNPITAWAFGPVGGTKDEQVPNAGAELDRINAMPSSAGNVPSPDNTQRAPAQAPNQSGTGMMPVGTSSPVDINKAYQQGLGAIKETQDVSAQMSQQRAQQEEKYLADSKELNDNYAQNLQQYQNNQKEALDMYKSGQINPNEYLDNMGTGGRIATAIGLMLGGISGGLNRTGVNPAAQYLNEQINRNIDAQKANLDQKKTLLGINRQVYGDNLQAEQATRGQLLDQYNHQIQLAAAQLGTPQAKATADAQSAQYAMEHAQLLQSMAMRSSVLNGIKTGSTAITPLALGNGAGLMSPEQALKEQSSVDKQNQAIANTNSIFDQLAHEQTAGNLLNLNSSARVRQLKAQLFPQLQSQEESKRLSSEVIDKLLDPFVTKTIESGDTDNSARFGVLNLVKQGHAGETPVTSQYAPQALPKYPTPPPGSSAAAGLPLAQRVAPGTLIRSKSTGKLVGTAGTNGKLVPLQ